MGFLSDDDIRSGSQLIDRTRDLLDQMRHASDRDRFLELRREFRDAQAELDRIMAAFEPE